MNPAAVLIVDDRADNLTALEESLAPLAIRITKAHSGAEALRSLLVEDYAVILLDVQMPDIDGFETARLIKNRTRTRHIPIIFLTAISREIEHQLHGYSTGAVDYLAKPFDPEVLRSKVSVFVALHDQSRVIEEQNRLLAERLDERDRAEHALSRHTAELQRSNAALDRLASAASDDILAPLQVLSGMLELLSLRHAADLGDEGKLLVERSRQRTLELAAMVERVLADAQEDLEPVRREPTDLNLVLDRARLNLGPLLDKADIALTADPLPTVMADEWQLVQVFIYLLVAAQRRSDLTRPAIHIGLSRRRKEWLISVADNGSGVPSAAAASGRQGLERPEREYAATVDARADSHGGYDTFDGGAGLAIARRLVERHGGTISTEAVPGRGTTTSFSLPEAV